METVGGSTSSTKQFVWCGNRRCEARNASSVVTAQYFSRGETISGTSYYWDLDHLGSIREMTNSSGSVVWQQSFDPYGRATTLVSTTPSDFGYAGYYFHTPSGLSLTRTRAYSPSLGRWLNRDPLGEPMPTDQAATPVAFGPSGAIWSRLQTPAQRTLYGYVSNDPVNFTDPLGLLQSDPSNGNAYDLGGGVTGFSWYTPPRPPMPGPINGPLPVPPPYSPPPKCPPKKKKEPPNPPSILCIGGGTSSSNRQPHTRLCGAEDYT